MRCRYLIPWLVTAICVGGCSDDKGTGTSPPEAEATYIVTFDATWSAITHPDSFPHNPHFSTLIGATHDASVSFWSTGILATTGIKDVAELGSPVVLRTEIMDAVDSGRAQFLLLGGNIGTSPGETSLIFNITVDHPRLTLVSMLAPSPDWFVGVSGLSLLQEDAWLDSLTVELFLYDAGTDSGPSYVSPNEATNPPDTITNIEGFPALVDGVIRSVGTFIFKRQ